MAFTWHITPSDIVSKNPCTVCLLASVSKCGWTALTHIPTLCVSCTKAQEGNALLLLIARRNVDIFPTIGSQGLIHKANSSNDTQAQKHQWTSASLCSFLQFYRELWLRWAATAPLCPNSAELCPMYKISWMERVVPPFSEFMTDVRVFTVYILLTFWSELAKTQLAYLENK